MRIAGGDKKGLTLTTKPGGGTRPLAARVKASLFEIISGRLPGIYFCDFFAGNGAVGLEALSRGAERALFVEKNPACIRIIRENARRCGFADRAEIVQGDVLKVIPTLARRDVDAVIFLGPPYDTGLAHESLIRLGQSESFSAELLVIAEVRKKETLQPVYGALRQMREKLYGDTRLVFYQK